MSADLTLHCTCGALHAVARDVSPKHGNRVVCYCDDCQAFAHFLGRAGEILDVHGGTEVFQISQARFRITSGVDRLACMRLSPNGLLRWYASCCNTPIGNTLPAPGMPFIGLIHSFIEGPRGTASRDAALGPIRGRVHRRFAKGDPSTLPRDGAPLPLIVFRLMRLMLLWRLRGDHKRSPLFEPGTARPIVAPRVLAAEQREAIRRRVLDR
jgi:hypothetical protein